jgi:precorrin-2/cobalt-factor-2 C20-methyltransferase
VSDVKRGKLYGLGVGPGDPELLTVKAVEVIKRVAVVFAAGSPKNDYSLALDTVKEYLRPDTEVVMLGFPMTYDRNALSESWEQNARSVLDVLDSGRDAAFITIGDPLTYSTFGYLIRTIEKLASGVDVETVPGITAYHAAAARVNMPLVEGKESLLVVSGVSDSDRMKDLIGLADNLVILKTYRNFNEICQSLHETAPDMKAVLVSRCGIEGERIVKDVDLVAGEDMPYLSLLLVKKNEPEQDG